MHVHGSFSEGVGSIDSHSHEATDVGADVIWWSDHDFRITSYGHVSTFGFEGWTEEMPTEPGAGPQAAKRGPHLKELVPVGADHAAPGEAEFVGGSVREGVKGLRLSSSSNSEDFASYKFEIVAYRGLFKRPLASGITLHLSVFSEALAPDARAVIEIGLSEHPSRLGLPFEAYHLRYILDDSGGEPYRDGTTFTIPVASRNGEWADLSLPITGDATRGFPFIHGDDNTLGSIVIGLETRRGSTAIARFDDLRIEQAFSGVEMFARQRSLIDTVGREYPRIQELQGVEASWVGHHLNEFSIDTRPVDYEMLMGRIPDSERGREFRDRLTQQVVDDIHSRGGLVSFNHMYGASMEGSPPRATREEILDELLASHAFGADILEVGYRDRGGHSLHDHLWVWDQLGLNGLFLVGTGVSDSHGGPDQRWRTDANNFLSWIYSRSPTKVDLIEGLRRGRVFFGDIVLFRGTVDLETDRGQHMGQIVVTPADKATISLKITDLAEDDDVRLLVSGAPAFQWRARDGALAISQQIAIDRVRPTIVRAEVYRSDGVAKVFSNPITFVPSASSIPNGLPPARTVRDSAR